jgi:hypothetical protein
VFTARYALSPYIKQIRFVFKGLKSSGEPVLWDMTLSDILYVTHVFPRRLILPPEEGSMRFSWNFGAYVLPLLHVLSFILQVGWRPPAWKWGQIFSSKGFYMSLTSFPKGLNFPAWLNFHEDERRIFLRNLGTCMPEYKGHIPEDLCRLQF